MNIVISICFALLGTLLGSYIAARAFRVIHAQTLDPWGRSKCVSCGHTLHFFDLFPILSFLFLKGKCRYCHAPISKLYVTVEITLALLFFAMGFGVSPDMGTHTLFSLGFLFLQLFFVTYLVYISIIDLFLLAFPVKGMVILTFFFVILSYFFQIPTTFEQSLLGLGFFVAVLFAIQFFGRIFFKKEVLGEGDLYVGAFMGSFLGLGLAIIAFYGAIFSGALYGICMLYLFKKKKSLQIPFAPFLAFGAYMALCLGIHIWDWYWGVLYLQ